MTPLNDKALFNKQTLDDLAASWAEQSPRQVIEGEPHKVQLWPLPGISEVCKLCDLEGIDSLPPAGCLQPLPTKFKLEPDGEHQWHITSVEGPDEAPLTLSSRLEDIAAHLRLEIMGPDHLPELLKALGHLEVAMLLLRNVGK